MRSKKPYYIVLAVIISATLLQGCQGMVRTIVVKNTASTLPIVSEPATIESTSLQNEDTTVTFLAAGDNIIHEAVYKDALNVLGEYNFEPMYEKIAPEIHNADFAFINQEGLLGGTSLGLAGYPLFNAPQEAGVALVNTGFNLISQSNNHAMDFGFKGIVNTCTFWKQQSGAVMAGISSSAIESENIPVLTKKGVKIALIAYTWSLNDIKYPAGKEWCVDTDFNNVLIKIQRARLLADVVLVSVHWGDEYSTVVNHEQKSQAQKLADAGADIIIGNHPHVIENISWINAADGRKTICAYAMGNLLSSQSFFENVIGGMLELTIIKSNSKIALQGARFVPIVTHYEKGYKAFKVYLLSDYSVALAANHGIADTADLSPSKIKSYVKSIISPEFYAE